MADPHFYRHASFTPAAQKGRPTPKRILSECAPALDPAVSSAPFFRKALPALPFPAFL